MVYLWQFKWILSKKFFGFLPYMLNTFAYLIGLDLLECVLICKTTFWKSYKKTLSDDFKFLLIGDLILHIKVRNAHEIFFLLLFFISSPPLILYPMCKVENESICMEEQESTWVKKINPPGEFFQRCVIVHMLQILMKNVYIFSNFPKISYIKLLAISIRL